MLDVAKKVFARLKSKSSVNINCVDGPLIDKLKNGNLTYLSNNKLAAISNTVRDVENRGIDGMFIEAGCALGGSAILISTLKSKQRVLGVYDVFGLIPAPTADDTEDVHQRYRVIVEGKSKGIGDDKYYGYEEDLLQKVKDNFSDFGIDIAGQNVRFIQGLLQDTMAVDGQVAFAHIDVDWYDPVKTSVERIFPNLVVGGSIIFDDYFDWGGCRKAVDAFLRTVVGKVSIDGSAGSLKVTRVAN